MALTQSSWSSLRTLQGIGSHFPVLSIQRRHILSRCFRGFSTWGPISGPETVLTSSDFFEAFGAPESPSQIRRKARRRAQIEARAAARPDTPHGLRAVRRAQRQLLPRAQRNLKSLRKMNAQPLPKDDPGVANQRFRIKTGQLFDKDGNINIHPALLRDVCKCERCVDPSDKQRTFSYAAIPRNIQIRTWSRSPEGIYTITWKHDIPGFEFHVSKFSQSDLDNLLPSSKEIDQFYQRPQPKWSSDTFSHKTKPISYHDFMNDESALAKVLLLMWNDGLVFLDNVPKDAASVGKIVERIGPLRNTFYGDTWDVRSVPQAKNVAYTSKNLGFHMDLLYMKNPPAFQFLHCLENTCRGGESRFADTYFAIDKLFQKDVELIHVLQRHRVRYEYKNDGFHYWDEKPTITLREHPIPHRGETNKPVNLMQKIGDVYWSPPFVGAMPEGLDKEDTELFMLASKRFAYLLELEEVVYETKMDPGTCAIFDNLRVVHARKEFNMNSGVRWLRGAYLDRQDFVSKAMSLSHLMPEI